MKFDVVMWIIDNPVTGCGHPVVRVTDSLDDAVDILLNAKNLEDGGISVHNPDDPSGGGEIICGIEKGHYTLDWFNGWTINGKKVEE